MDYESRVFLARSFLCITWISRSVRNSGSQSHISSKPEDRLQKLKHITMAKDLNKKKKREGNERRKRMWKDQKEDEFH